MRLLVKRGVKLNNVFKLLPVAIFLCSVSGTRLFFSLSLSIQTEPRKEVLFKFD